MGLLCLLPSGLGQRVHQQALVPHLSSSRSSPYYLPQQTRKRVLGEIQILAFLELLEQIFLEGEVGAIPSFEAFRSLPRIHGHLGPGPVPSCSPIQSVPS